LDRWLVVVVVVAVRPQLLTVGRSYLVPLPLQIVGAGRMRLKSVAAVAVVVAVRKHLGFEMAVRIHLKAVQSLLSAVPQAERTGMELLELLAAQREKP
jgi:hypothetical protein